MFLNNKKIHLIKIKCILHKKYSITSIEIFSNFMNLIEPLLVPHNYENTVIKSTKTPIIIQCIVYTQDPDHPNRRKRDYISQSATPDDKIDTFIKKLKNSMPNCSFESKTYLKFNYHYYCDGKFSERGINSNQTVEIISLESEQEATKNEGFIFAFWSLVPLMVSISFLIPGLVGTFDMVYRGLFILAGTIIGIPASILLIIGLTERYSESMRISFVNYSWFGPCCNCSCCNCCGCCHCCGCCGYDQDSIEQDNFDDTKKKSSKKKGHNDDEDQLMADNKSLNKDQI